MELQFTESAYSQYTEPDTLPKIITDKWYQLCQSLWCCSFVIECKPAGTEALLTCIHSDWARIIKFLTMKCCPVIWDGFFFKFSSQIVQLGHRMPPKGLVEIQTSQFWENQSNPRRGAILRLSRSLSLLLCSLWRMIRKPQQSKTEM